MRLRYGNMWDAYSSADLFLITTNATVKKNGALVMGRGIAKEARDRFPGLDLALGTAIAETGETAYGLLVSPNWPEAKLGAFQVKYNWREQADLSLISRSVLDLYMWCGEHPTAQVHLNYPGIGNGGLEEHLVEPLLLALPDMVTVWKYGTPLTNGTICF